MTDQTRSHPMCWQDDHYEHECARPSGRTCIDCGAPIGAQPATWSASTESQRNWKTWRRAIGTVRDD